MHSERHPHDLIEVQSHPLWTQKAHAASKRGGSLWNCSDRITGVPLAPSTDFECTSILQ